MKNKRGERERERERERVGHCSEVVINVLNTILKQESRKGERNIDKQNKKTNNKF